MQRKYIFNQDFFKNWSRPMAYILGFITADGYLNEKQYRLKVQINVKDISILEYIKLKTESNAPIKYQERVRNGKIYNHCSFELCSKIMTRDLQNLGISHNKTGNEIFPKNIQEDCIGDYIRGYFDGDGTVGIYQNKCSIGICCASRKFLESINSYFQNPYPIINTKIFSLAINLTYLDEFVKKLYDNEEFSLQRKKDLIYKILNNNTHTKYKEIEKRYIIDTYLKFGNESLPKIASEFNIGINSVRIQLRRWGIYKPKFKRTNRIGSINVFSR